MIWSTIQFGGCCLPQALQLGQESAHRHRAPASPATQVRFHSDRGIQYASADCRRALTQAGFVAAMSRKRYCYDNAALESFGAPSNSN